MPEQSNLRHAIGFQPVGKSVGDVEHRNIDVPGDRVIDLVRGVAGHQQPVDASRLKLLRGIDVELRDAVPIVGFLKRNEVGEVDALNRQACAVQPADALGDGPVDVLIIERGRGPAGPANDTKLAQSRLPLPQDHDV